MLPPRLPDVALLRGVRAEEPDRDRAEEPERELVLRDREAEDVRVAMLLRLRDGLSRHMSNTPLRVAHGALTRGVSVAA